MAKPEQKNVVSHQISSVPPEAKNPPLKVSIDENGELSQHMKNYVTTISTSAIQTPAAKMSNQSSSHAKVGIANKHRRKQEMASKCKSDISSETNTVETSTKEVENCLK